MRKQLIVASLLSLGILGCEPRQPELYVPVGHPANPQSSAGLRIGAPGALRPEVTRAEPAATKPAEKAPNPFSPTDRRRQSGAHQH